MKDKRLSQSDIVQMLMQQIKESFKLPGHQDLYKSNLMYPASMRAQICGRRPFSTRTGFLGMGPQNIQINDVVVLLQGAETPFVFRSGRNRLYELVGEAYVHGIMNGEFCGQRKPLKEFIFK